MPCRPVPFYSIPFQSISVGFNGVALRWIALDCVDAKIDVVADVGGMIWD